MKFTHVLGIAAAAGLMLTGCDSQGGGSRESIRAVGSSTVYPFAKLVAENFARSNPDLPSPLIESTGTGGGIALFCGGVGADTPDMVNASRRMKVSEFETCQANGVEEITEIQVGLDGLAFASTEGGIMMELTPEIVYRAIAANPFGEEQTTETWSDIDPSLPDVPILVYGPPSTSGTRDALKELILIPGCLADPRMQELEESDEDAFERTCTELRSDGKYVDQGEQDNLIVQKIQGNRNAVGVFGFSYLDANQGRVQGLPMNGIEPTYQNIVEGEYPGARPMFVYVKQAHLQAIPGLQKYLEQWMQMWDRNGPLSEIGLVVMPGEVMERNAAKIRNHPALTVADLESETRMEEIWDDQKAGAEAGGAE